jgi:hypothetical protein
VFRSFAKRPFARRLVALAAAYAIALSGLIVSFGAVRAAAAAATASGDVICHTARLDHPAPAGDNNSDCNGSCCIGCLMLLAAVPPPPTVSITIEQSPSRPIALPAIIDLPSTPYTKTHRSRAPPQSA